jgi:uncharacterized protein YndB with AHSA1/START domain
MPIPNTISRRLELRHPREKVWAALTTVEGLAGWFGNQVEGEIAPGQNVRMRWDHGHEACLAIKVVDPMDVFAYCWGIAGAAQGDPRRTYVEFRLEPVAAGTILIVTESGFAQLPDELVTSYEGNTQGWAAELAELVAYLDAA